MKMFLATYKGNGGYFLGLAKSKAALRRKSPMPARIKWEIVEIPMYPEFVQFLKQVSDLTGNNRENPNLNVENIICSAMHHAVNLVESGKLHKDKF